MSLTVIGTLAYDTIETAHDKREEILGGSAVYFSLASSCFSPTALVGVVGEDFLPAHIEAMESAGIDLAGLEIAQGSTFRWSGRYEADWNTRHTLDTQLNVLEHFDPKVPEVHQGARYVFLANASPKVQARGLDQITDPVFVMMDTMNLWIDIARDELVKLLARVDAVVLNDEEARMLTGEDNLWRAAEAVRALGPGLVVLKKGEHGAFLLAEDWRFSVPAYPVTDVIDPTGAGDSFAGGFMGYVAASDSVEPATLRQAMIYGTASASRCVEAFSTEQLEARSLDEIESRRDELLQMITP
jgi:sugar/nucleoside kinase (ribokinase family)